MSDNKPIEAVAVTQQGSTFAERAKARAARENPDVEADTKAVERDTDKAENKAVSKRTTSRKS